MNDIFLYSFVELKTSKFENNNDPFKFNLNLLQTLKQLQS
jgi:hypothetical protein